MEVCIAPTEDSRRIESSKMKEKVIRVRVLRVVVSVACLAVSLCSVQPADYFPPPDSEGGWRTLTDAGQLREHAGIDLGRLEQAYQFTERCTQNGGLLVVRRGYLVFEKNFH